ncbi:alpha/beta hydrolase [Bacillus sp. FJAT-49736]|uniref:alpha/beta hydrolase n=1 Tax=Bacillus sp. FJAT-49736 TaxID=2833582 RepID=UPI001BC93AA0|nr:alpha/beta hydrolase [Bacillus sp. FJAT-49736]MBS4173370.1 alpha/beta hydrolase [Bacillus sp. FJAT-49736]
MKKALSILGGTALLTAGLGFYISQRILYIMKKDENLILDRELKAKRIDPTLYEDLPKQEVWINSPFGYLIKAIVIRPYPEHKRFMIFSHGVTENKTNSIKYMNIFLKRGFNAIIYDHRRHGESEGKTTSYGFYEKDDLKAVVNYLVSTEGEDVYFGIHGESMGAATTLLYAGMVEDRADFYIVDCPFSDFREQLAYLFSKEMKLPGKWFLPLADLFVRLRGGYPLKMVSPISVVDRIQKPVLFIHSEKDDYILPEMTKALYARKKDRKMFFMASNGGHAQSFNENMEEYEQVIDEFLSTYMLNETSPIL